MEDITVKVVRISSSGAASDTEFGNKAESADDGSAISVSTRDALLVEVEWFVNRESLLREFKVLMYLYLIASIFCLGTDFYYTGVWSG